MLPRTTTRQLLKIDGSAFLKKEERGIRLGKCLVPLINNNFFKTISKMPKVKTNSGAKKRFTFTGSGKIKRKHAYKSHILTKKTKKQKRNLTKVSIVDKANLNSIRELLVKK